MKKIEALCHQVSNRECQSALKSGDVELAKNILRVKHQKDLTTFRELKDLRLLCRLNGLYKQESNVYIKMIITQEGIKETRRDLTCIYNYELSLQTIDCKKNTTVRFNIPKPQNKTSLFSCISGCL